MLSVRGAQMEALAGDFRTRRAVLHTQWLREDFPASFAIADDKLRQLVFEMTVAAREVGARSLLDMYKVIALHFLPEEITSSQSYAGAIGRTLIDTDVPIAARLQFIEQIIVAKATWPPASRQKG